MSSYMNGNKVTALKCLGNDVVRLYHNGQLQWEKPESGAVVIADILDYLQGDGTAYLLLGFQPNPAVTCYSMDFTLEETKTQAIAGSRVASSSLDNGSLTLFYINTYFRIDALGDAQRVTTSINNPFYFSYNAIENKATLNGTSYTNPTETKTNKRLTDFFVFYTTEASNPDAISTMKCTGFDIWEDGVDLYNLVPIRTKIELTDAVTGDTLPIGTVCMMDLLTRKIYSNAASSGGEFTAGEIIGTITTDSVMYSDEQPDYESALIDLGVEPASSRAQQRAQLAELGVTV